MIKIDIENDIVIIEEGENYKSYSLGSSEAFSLISKLWLRSGWDTKYVYSFTWMGRPIIQLPEDMIRIQELIYNVKPDVIIETGVAHGGSLIFYASLCKAMGKGRVIGIDIEIRPYNKEAIETHELYPHITLIEGNSVNIDVINKVKQLINPGEKVLVLLDSCHTKEHVLAELNAYGPLVGIDSYIVAMDGIMEQVVGAPRTETDWNWNNPKKAAEEFVANNREYIIEEPPFLFNEGSVREKVTYWPNGYIKKIR